MNSIQTHKPSANIGLTDLGLGQGQQWRGKNDLFIGNEFSSNPAGGIGDSFDLSESELKVIGVLQYLESPCLGSTANSGGSCSNGEEKNCEHSTFNQLSNGTNSHRWCGFNNEIRHMAKYNDNGITKRKQYNSNTEIAADKLAISYFQYSDLATEGNNTNRNNDIDHRNSFEMSHKPHLRLDTAGASSFKAVEPLLSPTLTVITPQNQRMEEVASYSNAHGMPQNVGNDVIPTSAADLFTSLILPGFTPVSGPNANLANFSGQSNQSRDCKSSEMHVFMNLGMNDTFNKGNDSTASNQNGSMSPSVGLNTIFSHSVPMRLSATSTAPLTQHLYTPRGFKNISNIKNNSVSKQEQNTVVVTEEDIHTEPRDEAEHCIDQSPRKEAPTTCTPLPLEPEIDDDICPLVSTPMHNYSVEEFPPLKSLFPLNWNTSKRSARRPGMNKKLDQTGSITAGSQSMLYSSQKQRPTGTSNKVYLLLSNGLAETPRKTNKTPSALLGISKERQRRQYSMLRKRSTCHFCLEIGANCGLVAGKCPNRPCASCSGRHRHGRCRLKKKLVRKTGRGIQGFTSGTPVVQNLDSFFEKDYITKTKCEYSWDT